MRYIMLIYSAEAANPAPGTPAFAKMMDGYHSFTDQVREAGQLNAGDALQPAATATTVRVRDGKTSTTDGPFAETKEILGGFYILDCKDLDEAIARAAQIPTAEFGSIEVRPIWEIEEEA